MIWGIWFDLIDEQDCMYVCMVGCDVIFFCFFVVVVIAIIVVFVVGQAG